MTEKEEKAIKYLNELIEELQCDINMFGFEDDCEEEQNLLVEQRDNFKTILNLIENQKKENERLKMYIKENEVYKTNLFNYAEQKDKEIAELRIKQINSNLNNSIKQKQKVFEQLQALNEGWKIELEKKDKEISELKAKYNKDTHTLQNQLDVANADLYECNNIISDYIDIVENKDKIIDLMATTLQDYSDYFRRMRKEEIKQYFDFERKVRKENEKNNERNIKY